MLCFIKDLESIQQNRIINERKTQQKTKWKSNKPMNGTKKKNEAKNNVVSKQNKNSWERIGMTVSKRDDNRRQRRIRCTPTHLCVYIKCTASHRQIEVNGSEDKLSICQIHFLLFGLLLVLLFDRCFVRWLFGKLSQFRWLSILLVEQYLSMKSNCCRCVYSASCQRCVCRTLG